MDKAPDGFTSGLVCAKKLSNNELHEQSRRAFLEFWNFFLLCQSERYVRRVSWNTGNQSTMPNNNTITFLLIVVISVLTGVFFEPPPPLTKKQLLRTIDANASESKSDADLNIAVGTNICVDLIVSANDFFEVLPSLPTHVDDVDPDSSIDSEQDLVDTFAYFFGRGAAAERIGSDAVVLDAHELAPRADGSGLVVIGPRVNDARGAVDRVQGRPVGREGEPVRDAEPLVERRDLAVVFEAQ